jgi:hypothetical protein
LDTELVLGRVFLARLWAANDTEGGTWGIQVGGFRGKEPVLEMMNELLLLGSLFNLSETFEVGVSGKLRRDRAFATEEEEREFLEPGFAVGGQKTRPPIGVGEIFARERQFLEIIFEQQPCALRVGAGGEDSEEFLALGDGGFGVGQFASEVRKGSVGF